MNSRERNNEKKSKYILFCHYLELYFFMTARKVTYPDNSVQSYHTRHKSFAAVKATNTMWANMGLIYFFLE